MQYYIHHRLAVAGHKGGRIFSSTALYFMYLKSEGTPRLVNILAHKALLAAYGKGKHEVGFSEVFAAVSDTKSVESFWRKMNVHAFSLSIFLSIFGGALLAYPK
jgi:MSHA biogenesis protein MshM